MSKKKFCFVSCAFTDERYIQQQDRLKESILSIYPNANIVFNRGTVADGSLQMNDSLYGFKVHAINNVWNDYDYVIWVDPAMVLQREIDELFTITDNNEGVYAVKDENLLCNTTSDLALEYFGTMRETIKELKLNLVGGSLYVFNTNSPTAQSVFKMWYDSELQGIFGTQAQAASNRINGHRNDETCMAFSMYINLIHPIPPDVAMYNVTENPFFIKKHFK